MDLPYRFSVEMDVRDYELDLQGIVNNSVYLNYLEHCRHAFLRSLGLDFAALHAAGKDAVVVRMEIDYKLPLKSGDRFRVELGVEKKGRLRLLFPQRIVRLPDETVSIEAVVHATVLVHGRPGVCEEIDAALAGKGLI